jgi:hypothetical protein
LCLIYIFDYKAQKTGKVFWFAFTCILLILLSGLRYRIGGDTLGYMEMYDDFPTLFTVDWKNFETQFQPLWVLFVLINKTITPDFALLQFTHAIILNVSLFSFIKKRTNHLFTFLFFYFIFRYFVLNFEVLRESLAVAIFLMGFKYWENKKWLSYYIFAFIGFGFHVSAVFLFFLPLFRNIELKLKTIFIFLIISILFSNIFFDFFMKISLFLELTGNLGGKVYGQIESIQDNSYNWRFRLLIIGQKVILPYIIIVLSKYANSKYKIQYPSLIFLYLLVSCFSILTFIVERFPNYIFVFYLLFLSDFIILFMRKYRKISFIFFLSIVILFTTMDAYFSFRKNNYGVSNYKKYYPYYSIFTKQEDKERELMYQSR